MDWPQKPEGAQRCAPTLDAGRVWAQVEERLAPMLRMDAFERAVYYYLLREGVMRGARRRVWMTHARLAELTGYKGLGGWRRLQGLCAKGCVRIWRGDERSWSIEVRTPEEVLTRLEESEQPAGGAPSVARDHAVRSAIYRRECGRCFYCWRYMRRENLTVDHVVPTAGGGEDSLRNLVACCYECNFTKWTQPAGDFLRQLYRRNLLTKYEVDLAVRRLKALAAGKLRLRMMSCKGKKRKQGEATAGDAAVAAMGGRMV